MVIKPTPALPALPSPGRLVRAELIAPGQFVYTRPLSRSAREWCEVRARRMLRTNVRLDLVRPDGKQFWWTLTPDHVLRTADARPATLPQAELARRTLKAAFPDAGFRVRASSGSTAVTWVDGPSTAQVMGLLADAGLTHMRCARTVSGQAIATALVRQMREDSLDSANRADRHQRLLDDLSAFSQTEWALGKQLFAFAGCTDDRCHLTAAAHRFPLTVLADTAGVPCPPPLVVCRDCGAVPRFSVRPSGRTELLLCCAGCLSRYRYGGVEILPVDRG